MEKVRSTALLTSELRRNKQRNGCVTSARYPSNLRRIIYSSNIFPTVRIIERDSGSLARLFVVRRICWLLVNIHGIYFNRSITTRQTRIETASNDRTDTLEPAVTEFESRLSRETKPGTKRSLSTFSTYLFARNRPLGRNARVLRSRMHNCIVVSASNERRGYPSTSSSQDRKVAAEPSP